MLLIKTAGEIQNDLVKKDREAYSPYDLGYAISDDLDEQVNDCIQRHINTFAKPEFCVVMVLSTDPSLITVVRRKFYAWPYLPCPMPSQSVWLYSNGKVRFLWALPDQNTMMDLVEAAVVNPEYQRMKDWATWYYNFDFWTNIREQHGIEMLSEREFNNRNREEGGQFVDDYTLGDFSDPSYLPEIRIKKLEAKANARSMQFTNHIARQPD
jgi:hypothetical protein